MAGLVITVLGKEPDGATHSLLQGPGGSPMNCEGRSDGIRRAAHRDVALLVTHTAVEEKSVDLILGRGRAYLGKGFAVSVKIDPNV